jgi:hypothetical protein
MASGPDPPASSWWRDPLLWALIAVAGLLRVVGITRQALWYDETILVALAQISARAWLGKLSDPAMMVARLAKASVVVALLRVTMAIFGASELALRAPFVVIGAATLIPLYLLARSLAGRRVALLACALLAVSSFHIYHSQQVSEYGLLMLVGLLSLWRWQEGRGGFVALNWAGLVVHPLNALVSGIETVLHLLHSGGFGRRPLRDARFLLNLAPLLACLGFGAVMLGARGGRLARSVLGWVPPLSPGRVVVALREYSHGVMSHSELAFTEQEHPPELTVMLVVMLALCAAGAAGLLRNNRAALRVLAVWLLAPLFVGVLVSLTVANVWVPRYFIIVLPAYLILCAAGIDLLAGRRVGLRAVAVALPLLTMLFFNFRQHYRDPGTGLREIAAEVHAGLGPGDGVICAPERITLPFGYYYDGDLPGWLGRAVALHRRIDPGTFWLTTDFARQEKRLERQPGFERWLRRHRRVWVVAVTDWPGDAQTPSLLAHLRQHLRLVDRSTGFNYSGAELLIFDRR